MAVCDLCSDVAVFGHAVGSRIPSAPAAQRADSLHSPVPVTVPPN